MKAGLGAAVGAVRLVVAAAIILALAYVLGWQILYSGPVGNDTLFQLHLVQWVNSSFPGLGWWYRWDDHGIAYREGYPLAAHWITAALHRASGFSLGQAMQVVEFAISPLDALGIYVYCAWRLQRPLVGLLAGVAYLLSPLSWTFIVDWGFYSNQAGTVFFMPAVIAVDIFFEEWSAGRRAWRFRLAALATMALIALMGLVAPFLLGAAIAVVFLYGVGATLGGVRRVAAWVFVVAPLLTAGAFVLTAFWSWPQQAYLLFINTHVAPRAFDPSSFPVWSLGQVFGFHPMRLDQIADHASITPAVGLPAAVGVLAAAVNARARALVALVAYGLLTMTTTGLEQLAWNVPVLGYLVHARAGVTLVQFFIPLLAGLGLSEIPATIATVVAAAMRWKGRRKTVTAGVLLLAALGLQAVAVGRFADWVDAQPQRLAYGGFQPASNDIWQRHPLEAAPVVAAVSQLAPGSWRPVDVGCALPLCPNELPLTQFGGLFAAPPQRAVLDAHVAPLLMDFNGLTGGAQAYTYNFQLPASPELDNWVLDSMLNRPGTEVKKELAQTTGIDAVVLGKTQVGRAADYSALGWAQTSSAPLIFVNPAPSGLASEWPAGVAALVIGSDQQSASHPYNDIFERATTGLIPSSEAWLVRGRTPYVDEYSAAELARFPALVLVGYRYHDQAKAWGLLDSYVRAGGALYVETGWQYVDPDWDLGSPAPRVLPVGELRWGALDPAARVVVDGSAKPTWGSMSYQGGGWGASSAGTGQLRSGAQALVSVGGRVVVASEQLGRGRVVWSGMNLIAHDAAAQSATEDAFVTGLFAWLFSPTTAPGDAALTWTSDETAQVQLAAARGATWVMLKESYAPGWSAELTWPGGSRSVPLLDGELDFLVARLDSVPAGSTLTFTYGPTLVGVAGSVVSALGLLLMVIWVVRPRWLVLGAGPLRRLGGAFTRRIVASDEG